MTISSFFPILQVGDVVNQWLLQDVVVPPCVPYHYLLEPLLTYKVRCTLCKKETLCVAQDLSSFNPCAHRQNAPKMTKLEREALKLYGVLTPQIVEQYRLGKIRLRKEHLSEKDMERIVKRNPSKPFNPRQKGY